MSGLTVKRIGPIDQNLILPLGKTCKCLGHVVPRHSKKYHFASRCLFLGGSHGSRTKLIDNFSQAARPSAIAKLYIMAGLQCPFCERLCESSCSNGSDFHKLSFLNWAFQVRRRQSRILYSVPCELHGPIPVKRVGVIRVM